MHPNILLATLVVNHSSTAFWHADNKVGEQFREYGQLDWCHITPELNFDLFANIYNRNVSGQVQWLLNEL